MTIYALVQNATIQSVGQLPNAARRLDTQQWVLGLPDADVSFQQACGYYPVTDVARPADDATTTYDRSITLVAGVPTVTWTARPKTADEIAAATANTNRQTITAQAQTALTANTTYLAIGSPTNAQIAAQVRALTQQSNKLIRLAINQLDGVS